VKNISNVHAARKLYKPELAGISKKVFNFLMGTNEIKY
jgi:hypothetical protein